MKLTLHGVLGFWFFSTFWLFGFGFGFFPHLCCGFLYCISYISSSLEFLVILKHISSFFSTNKALILVVGFFFFFFFGCLIFSADKTNFQPLKQIPVDMGVPDCINKDKQVLKNLKSFIRMYWRKIHLCQNISLGTTGRVISWEHARCISVRGLRGLHRRIMVH